MKNLLSRGNADVIPQWQQGWEENIPRVTDNIPYRVDRLRALGNAVVPQIVQVIGEAILEADSEVNR